MKKIHKSTIISNNSEVEKIPQNKGFLEMLPNLLKLFPNFDISKAVQSIFSEKAENNQVEPVKATQISAQKYRKNQKSAALFLENHQKLLTEIKKNRP